MGTDNMDELLPFLGSVNGTEQVRETDDGVQWGT